MTLHKILAFITCISITIIIPTNFAFAKKQSLPKRLTANSAILIDIKNNKTLFAKNIHRRLAPASTTKVMTAILVLEKLNLARNVVASQNACNQQPSKANLVPGVSYKVEDLLHAMLMSSSNDAATCLAEAISGSEQKFAKLMNKRAKQLRCRNTYFINSNGLSSPNGHQYTSAYDLSIMIRKLVKFSKALEIMKKKSYLFRGSNGIVITATNHNKLLWRHPNVAIGKTGYTLRAQHCFVGNDILRDKEIVFAVLKSKSLWPDVKYLLRLAKCI